MTIRFDRIDNFWFVLLHELGHIFLHHSSGLDDGFFDDMDADAETALEQQADDFAYDALIPKELWKTSPARFAKRLSRNVWRGWMVGARCDSGRLSKPVWTVSCGPRPPVGGIAASTCVTQAM